MAWARFDDRFPTHPRVIGLTDGAFRLYVEGVCYATSHLTDGVVARALAGSRDGAAGELVSAGLWLTDRAGWRIHDWHEWNPTADEIRQRRKADADRKRRQRRDDGGRFTP